MGSSNTVKPTEQETEQAKISAEQWEAYKTNGIPLENEYIRLQTGYVQNADGQYEVDPNSRILNQDGTVRVQTGAVHGANEAGFTEAAMQVNPNRLEQAEEINREGAKAGALGAAGMALEQQRNHKRGVMDAIAMGQGQEGEALSRQSQLTQQAQQEQMAQASESAQNSATNAHLAGNLAGIGASMYGNRTGSDSSSAIDNVPTPNPHTR